MLVVDAGKTGYVIDKERIRQIRDEHGQTYPDFLMKYGKQYYPSKSIIGILYRNALSYKNGNTNELNAAFAQMGIEDKGLQVSTPTALTSLVRKKIEIFSELYDLNILASE